MAKTVGAATKQPGRIRRYFRESIAELRKVNWPTRQEATRLTVVVVVVVSLMSALLGLLDFAFSRLIAWIVTLGG